jgi:hypothetical protein
MNVPVRVIYSYLSIHIYKYIIGIKFDLFLQPLLRTLISYILHSILFYSADTLRVFRSIDTLKKAASFSRLFLDAVPNQKY